MRTEASSRRGLGSQADAHRWHSDNRNQELLLPSGKRLAEGEELLQSRREEVDDQVIEYIEASSRAQKEREEKDRQAERALIEAAEAAKRERLEREAERLEREAERRSLAAAAASRLARRTRYAAIVATVLALMAGAGAFVGFRGQQEATRNAELADKRGQASCRKGGARGARPGAAQSVSFAFVSFAANRGERRYRGRDPAGAGSTAEEQIWSRRGHISLKQRPHFTSALLAHHQTTVFHHDAGVTHAAFNRTGDRIVTASYDKTARIWDVSNGTETAVLKGHEGRRGES